MDDELTRARRALGVVSGELDLTWGDVLERAEAGREVVPVVPLDGSRRDRRTTGRRVAVAAVLVGALAVGLGAVEQLVVGRGALTPAGTVPVDTPHHDGRGDTSSAAQLIVDRTREALRATAFCGVTLQASEPRTTLALDATLTPTALDDGWGKRGRTSNGGWVAVDTTAGTWWKLHSAADIVADRPDLQAGIDALRLLVGTGGTWRLADDGTADAVTTDLGDGPVTIAVDARTGLPVRLTRAAAGGFAVTWAPSCSGSSGGNATVTVPPGYTGGPASG